MAYLYRGVSLVMDQLNECQLRPKGSQSAVRMTYGDGFVGMRHDGKFTHGNSEDNAARGHQLRSGLHNGCFLSFTRSLDMAIKFATVKNTVQGFVYVVDEERLESYGVVAKEYPDPEYPAEMEVSLRAMDNGNLPSQIIVAKELKVPK